MKHTRRKSNGTRSHLVLLTFFLVAVVALIFTVPIASAGHGHEKVELDDATIIVEVNATDGDAGFQIFLDGEGWKRVSIYDPNWRQIFKVKTRGGVREIGGGTELFLETAEPEFETPDELQELLDLLPPGDYRFYGRTVEGDWLHGTAELTHNIPCAPELVQPAEVDPEEQEPNVVPEPVNISWEEVENLLGPDPDEPEEVGCTEEEAEIVGYQVIVEDEEAGQEFNITLPADATNVTVPDEFTLPNRVYKFEVLAIEDSGNQTIAESFFCTGPTITSAQCQILAQEL
jgi:hypothetical protein